MTNTAKVATKVTLSNTVKATPKVAPKSTVEEVAAEEEKTISKTYTYEEAIDEVLKLWNSLGSMPCEEHYVRAGINPEILLDALDVKGDDMWNVVKKNNSKPYAGVNILVLQELRRRKGERVHIAAKDGSSWKEFTTVNNLFPIEED